MKNKSLIALIVVLTALTLGLAASAAGAAECTTNILCLNGGAGEGLRDDLVEPPTFGGFGTDILAVNTQSPLRLCEKSGAGVGCEGTVNKNPKADAFFGIKLHVNPKTQALRCEKAEGWVQWADIQNAKSGANVSPMFAGTSVGENGPWDLTIWSDKATPCGVKTGVVEIRHFAAYFPALGGAPGWEVTTPATGAITGKYEQPGANCEAGGVKLEVAQMLEINGPPAKSFAIDNGTALTNVYLCFVSANDYVYPEIGAEKTGPAWGALHGTIWKD